MNDRDCENCVHKVNGACTAWECRFEPKRGITKEEAIEIIECGEISNRWGEMGKEVERMAIEALKKKPSISEDGTLTVNVEDGSKVSRVLVCGDNHFGGLYYPEQEPKTGHWIVDRSVDCYLDKVRCHCSECGKKKEFPADYDHIKQELSISYKYPEVIDNFCPNCGAKMVEPQESEEV